MKVRTLDSNWDFKFGRSKQDYAVDSLGCAYDVKQKIQCWYEDCFFDMTTGIDYKNLLGEKGGKEELDNAIKKILLVEPDITEISYFDSSVSGRTYSATIRFKTVYNESIEVKI